jgi:hypothetical protein
MMSARAPSPKYELVVVDGSGGVVAAMNLSCYICSDDDEDDGGVSVDVAVLATCRGRGIAPSTLTSLEKDRTMAWGTDGTKARKEGGRRRPLVRRRQLGHYSTMSNVADGRVPAPMARGAPIQLSAVEFETLVAELFGQASSQVEGLRVTKHDRIGGVDGTYDFDATIRYRWAGMEFLVVVEAKRHSGAIERQFVQVLDSKRGSVGAHKAILVSTAPFQSGAIEFARVHGIALVHIGTQTHFVVRSPDRAEGSRRRAIVARCWQLLENGALRATTVSGRPQEAAELLLGIDRSSSPADPDALKG